MKYHDHTEILPLLEGAGQSWAHVKDDDTRRELRTTLAFGFAEINGASALDGLAFTGKPLPPEHEKGRPLNALLDAAYSQLDDDGRHLQALREQLACQGGRHAKR